MGVFKRILHYIKGLFIYKQHEYFFNSSDNKQMNHYAGLFDDDSYRIYTRYNDTTIEKYFYISGVKYEVSDVIHDNKGVD